MSDPNATPVLDRPETAMLPASLEAALARTEADALTALKGAEGAVKAVRRFKAAAQAGDLKGLRKSLDDADQATAALRQQLANAREGWAFDEETHFSQGAYLRELIGAAREAGVRLDERDGKLYAYPVIVRVKLADRAVQIDRKLSRKVRPSVLAGHLADLQQRPPAFKAATFLEYLHEAYLHLAKPLAREVASPVVRLADVHGLLTILPGAAKDYGLDEFARDIYLLDQSGVTRTKSGAVVSFPASTGTKTGGALIVVAQDGTERRYVGLSFTKAG